MVADRRHIFEINKPISIMRNQLLIIMVNKYRSRPNMDLGGGGIGKFTKNNKQYPRDFQYGFHCLIITCYSAKFQFRSINMTKGTEKEDYCSNEV